MTALKIVGFVLYMAAVAFVFAAVARVLGVTELWMQVIAGGIGAVVAAMIAID